MDIGSKPDGEKISKLNVKEINRPGVRKAQVDSYLCCNYRR